MSASTGIALAFVSMLCWGFGDFFIQRSTRKIGNVETLFIITLFGSLILLPFVYRGLSGIFTGSGFTLLILFTASAVLFFAALLDFEALKIGKLAVVEPIWSFEIPVASFLAFFVLGERINAIQIVLIVFLILGLIAVSLRGNYPLKKFLFEKGVFLAFIAAIFMGSANFFFGWGEFF